MVKDSETRAIPAASVVILRTCIHGFEVLLLKRSKDVSYLGGAWVFPGGRVDEDDVVCGNQESMDTAYRTALRETREECGIILVSEQLTPMALWVTPEGFPKRFSTYFFLAEDSYSKVVVDGMEIETHVWMTPLQALAGHKEGDMFFAPPNYVTLVHLSGYDRVEDVMRHYRNSVILDYRPKIEHGPDGVFSVYEEDDDYDVCGTLRRGKRHRLWMRESGWVYEKNY